MDPITQRVRILQKALEINPNFSPIKDFTDDFQNNVKKWADTFKKESVVPTTRPQSSLIPPTAGKATPVKKPTPNAMEQLQQSKYNVPAQVEALPEFLKNIVSPPKPESLANITRERPLGDTTPKEPEEDVGLTPTQESMLRGYDPANMLRSLGDDKTFIDPFGNRILKHTATPEELAKIKKEYGVDQPATSYVTLRYPNTPQDKYWQQVQDYNSSLYEPTGEGNQVIPRVQVETIRKSQTQKPFAENEEFRIYKFDAPEDRLSPLERENIKRAAFNLPPLKEFSEEETQKQKDPVIIVENKVTGERKIAYGPPALHPQIIDHSSSISVDSMRDLGGLKGREVYNQLSETDLRMLASAPKEIKEKLNLKGESYVGSFGTKTITFSDGTVLDTENLVNSVLKEEPQESSLTITPVPDPFGPFRRFNLKAQIQALGELVSGKNYSPNLGVRKDLPTGDELKKIQSKIDKSVAPAVVTVGVPRTEPAPSVKQLEYSDSGLVTSVRDTSDIKPIGSAFHVGNGYIVTAEHVTEASGGERVILSTKDGKKHEAEILYANPKDDWSILRAPTMRNYNSVGLGSYDELAQNKAQERQFLVTVGFPGGRTPLKTQRGILSRTSEEQLLESGRESVPSFSVGEFSTNFYSGQSGGVLVDKNGNAVGIVSFAIDNPNYPKFQGGFVPIDEIKSKLQELRK